MTPLLSNAIFRKVTIDRVRSDAGLRELTDPLTMRALAHPVRLALIELLSVDGPHTATEAGEVIGESPSSCSFPLRQLAKYGFVEEAGPRPGRQRPWRMTQVGTTFGNIHADAETSVAADALVGMVQERYFERWRRWRATVRAYPPEWQEVGGSSETVWWVTPAEQRELDQEITELVSRYRDRLLDPSLRPPDAQPVEFVALAFPFRAPPVKVD